MAASAAACSLSGVLLVLCLSCCTLSASQPSAAVAATPEILVQISTFTTVGTLRTLRDTLLFEPPDGLLHFVKQLYRDSESSHVYVSLRLHSEADAAAPSTGNSTQFYLTRRNVQQPEPYDRNVNFGSFGDEYRLFRSRCCGCGPKQAPVAFYWPKVESSSYTRLLTAVEISDSFALAKDNIMKPKVVCRSSNLKIQEHPYVERRSGAPHPTAAPRGRPRQSTGKIRVQLAVDYGGEKFVVGVAGANVMTVFPYGNMSCNIGATFFYEGFEEYHVDVNGQITSRASFTLLHEATRSYVVADVLDSMALNVGENLTGLRLQNEADFLSDAPTSPDYRFFVRYDMTDAEILSSRKDAYVKYGSPPLTNGYIAPRQMLIMCPLFHRRYCIEPTKSGPLRLESVSSGYTSGAPFPTLSDSPLGFAEFTTR